MKYLNILDCSPIVDLILTAKMFPDFTFEVNRRVRSLCYYLEHGIYPKSAIFVNTISEEFPKKERHFSAAKEGAGNDVERALGVLVSRWHILQNPFKF